ncbi:MAG TPA: hypothetical protein VGN20_19530 [Mucilaginibacter sp.]|jgi:predicted GH43/DUF377 family glycosyl hydrolase
MIDVKKEGVILRTTNLNFENDGVLNPAVIKEGDIIHLFYRAVRKGNFSTIGYCALNTPLRIRARMNKPFLSPEFEYESHGMEDPRIVKIDKLYYLSYIAFNGTNALGALATSSDLKYFKKEGIIVAQIKYDDFRKLTKGKVELFERYSSYIKGEQDFVADKDFVFFPRRVNGKLTFLHRIKPDIQIVSVKSLGELTKEFWENYFRHFEEHIMLASKYPHEVDYVGSGCPPIETEHGWLFIYHGVKDAVKGYEYSACAALLDLDDPRKEIARLPYPLFKPELDYELAGDVDDVCFPTGTVLVGDILYIYYGAADDIIACASVSFLGLIKELLLNKEL